MTEAPSVSSTARRWSISPFLAFALVAGLAIFGAVWEDSYWATSPALWSAALPTTLGIVAAAVVFFVLAWWAPDNA
jgi:hypothetical protein